MIRITSLGGSGEDSRNCFLVESEHLTVLLDCGVCREIADPSIVYPSLNKEIAYKIDLVLLSHCHEDHSAGLGYLYQLGYRGPIYGSKETLENVISFNKKWIKYVKDNNGNLPFDENNINCLNLQPIEKCHELDIKYGKSGHILGSLWFCMTLDNKSVLYTGDLCFDSYLLKTDPLPKADILIIDCAYGDSVLSQKDQYISLVQAAEETLSKQGRLLLPIPANGRGIDMAEVLKNNQIVVCVERSLYDSAQKTFIQSKWLNDVCFNNNHFILVNDENRDSVLNNAAVILCSDGMMTSSISNYYYQHLKNDERNTILLSGHQAKGTLGEQLLNNRFRTENNVCCQINHLIIKVHPDYADVMNAIKSVQPQAVVLFHCNHSECKILFEEIQNRNIDVLCKTKKSLEIL